MRRVLTNTSVVRCSRHQLRQSVVDLRPDLARHHRLERRRRQPPAPDRGCGRGRYRRWCSAGTGMPRRSGTSPLPRSAFASPTVRRASARRRSTPAAVRARAPDARRACCRRWREFHRRSRCGRLRACRGRTASPARCTATRAWSPRCAAPCAACRRVPACVVSPVRTTARISTSGSFKRRELFANALERRLEIALDVVRQSLQRRHVHHARLVRQRSCQPSLTSWSIAARKAANVLPDPVGAATKTCCPRLQGRPRLLLRGRRRIESPRKPRGNGGMQDIQCVHGMPRVYWASASFLRLSKPAW